VSSNQLLDQDFQQGCNELIFQFNGNTYTAMLNYIPENSNIVTLRICKGWALELELLYTIKIKVEKRNATSWIIDSCPEGTDKQLRDLVRDSILRAYMITPTESTVQSFFIKTNAKPLITKHWLNRNQLMICNDGEILPKRTATAPSATPLSSLLRLVSK
jgi:hypothetical protein